MDKISVSEPGVGSSEDDKSIFPISKALDIQDGKKTIEEDNENVGEVTTLEKQENNGQVLMTNDGENLNDATKYLLQFYQSPSPRFQQPGKSRQSQQCRQRQKRPQSFDKRMMQLLINAPIIPNGWNVMKYTVNLDNIVYVKNKHSIYSPVYYKAAFMMSDQVYFSVDDVYQSTKLNDLCGQVFAQVYLRKTTVGEKRAFVRDCIEFLGISKEKVIDWRNTKGLDVIIKATFNKFTQNEELLEIMKKDRNKLICNIFGDDSIDGCGTQKDVEIWADRAKGTTCIIPCEATPINLHNFPTIGCGKNIQGVIIMIVRHMISLQYNW
uniref:DUF1768 domain-containing protein n=1 Tax=Strongyloides papillosus TaxID=174720 RepID=A0A0N5BGP5_STREA